MAGSFVFFRERAKEDIFPIDLLAFGMAGCHQYRSDDSADDTNNHPQGLLLHQPNIMDAVYACR